MKKAIILSCLVVFTITLSSFYTYSIQDISVGDELTISEPSSSSYAYIHFPKKNFILKKGGTLNFKSLKGTKVIVTEISKSKSGDILIKVMKKNGGSFLNTLKTLNIEYDKAIKNSEVIK